MARTGEDKIGVAVMRIAAAQPNGIATHEHIRDELPKLVDLTDDDWVASTTREGEPMWHQIVRNIKSHHATEGNPIAEGYLKHVPGTGYEITDAGRRYLKSKGL